MSWISLPFLIFEAHTNWVSLIYSYLGYLSEILSPQSSHPLPIARSPTFQLKSTPQKQGPLASIVVFSLLLGTIRDRSDLGNNIVQVPAISDPHLVGSSSNQTGEADPANRHKP